MFSFGEVFDYLSQKHIRSHIFKSTPKDKQASNGKQQVSDEDTDAESEFS